jgi:hypothetical protein
MGLCGLLDLRQGRRGSRSGNWRHPTRDTAVKDLITSKLFIVVAVIAAVGFAVWSGLHTNVESPAADATLHGAFTTPF